MHVSYLDKFLDKKIKSLNFLPYCIVTQVSHIGKFLGKNNQKVEFFTLFALKENVSIPNSNRRKKLPCVILVFSTPFDTSTTAVFPNFRTPYQSKNCSE